MKAESESPIRTFAHGDDAAYEEWVGQHGGYVLTQRSGRSGEFMLHDSECLHLELTGGSFTLTTRPRRWAKTRQPLVEWATEHNGSKPLLCHVRDALRSVMLGEERSEHYTPSIVALLEQPGVNELDVKVLRVRWKDGAPFLRDPTAFGYS